MGDESLKAWTRILVLGVRLQCDLKFKAMNFVNYLNINSILFIQLFMLFKNIVLFRCNIAN